MKIECGDVSIKAMLQISLELTLWSESISLILSWKLKFLSTFEMLKTNLLTEFLNSVSTIRFDKNLGLGYSVSKFSCSSLVWLSKNVWFSKRFFIYENFSYKRIGFSMFFHSSFEWFGLQQLIVRNLPKQYLQILSWNLGTIYFNHLHSFRIPMRTHLSAHFKTALRVFNILMKITLDLKICRSCLKRQKAYFV